MKNKFCTMSALKNESDVEQFFVIRLIHDLGYKDENIHTKGTISIKKIGKGKTKKNYRPDYIIYYNNSPAIIIDAKSPKENVDEGLNDSLMYAREVNGGYTGKNPIQYCIGTNAKYTKICRWDENSPLITLQFNEFQDSNENYKKLKSVISILGLKETSQDIPKNEFRFEKPKMKEINGIFKKCHNLIWKREKSGPTAAFYEFCKLMFIKLNEDKKLMLKKANKSFLLMNDFIFSVCWIKQQEKVIPNPVNSILFKNLKNELEEKIEAKEKKRIFEKNEEIDLKPSTIEQIVRLLENCDLISIDEDLNGRLFEAFLSATIRGKELGQFFTPRNVVKFMTKIADLKVDFNNKTIDKILDACSGTGGFLIEAMVDLTTKVRSNNSLTNKEKEQLHKKIRTESIYGVDASKMISRIARINMYLHGDGGSKIYQLESLDKKINIESGINTELKNECLEFKKQIIDNNLKFDVVLTNPPFSMTYQKKEADEREILEEYYLAFDQQTGRMYSSLKSNVMFIERYYELLKPHGKLITIIDESLLNTSSNKQFRNFIKDKFIIKAIISLPENTFVKAGTGVKSSILYLTKRESKEEKQSSVFMAMCNNIGHNDSGKLEPELNELFLIKDESIYDFNKGIIGDFAKFQSGEFKNATYDTKYLPNEDSWKTFVVDELDADRLDVRFHSPYLKYLREYLKQNKWDHLGKLINLEKSISPQITDYYRLIDLRDVEQKKARVLRIKEVEELGSEKILFVRGQLLISLLSPEKGKIILVNEKLAGCVGSTEFLPITLNSDKITIEYLWVILRSKIITDQWKYQVTGSTPSRYRIGDREIKETIVPIPSDNLQLEYSSKIIQSIKENDELNSAFEIILKSSEDTYINKIFRAGKS